MFNADINIKLNHEIYNDGKYQIKKAGVCDIYDIGGKPNYYEADITSYVCSNELEYYYYLDYVIFIEEYIMGYFIGDIGYNCIDTQFSKKEDKVYYLLDICMEYVVEEKFNHIPFNLLIEYLLRHCKNNNCKLLELKIDFNNKFVKFYEYLKSNFNFVEYNGYLLKQII